jgi:hypothetical protein
MDDAARVSVRERIRDLGSVFDELLDRQALARDRVGERPPSTYSIAMNA